MKSENPNLRKRVDFTLSRENQEWLRRQAEPASQIVDRLVTQEREGAQAEVVITKNLAFAQWLIEEGIAQANCEIISMAGSRDVEGRIIAGNLPLSLCARAQMVIQVDMEIPESLRLDQMSIEQLQATRYSVSRYRVERK